MAIDRMSNSRSATKSMYYYYDLEALFHVFIFACCTYSGPNQGAVADTSKFYKAEWSGFHPGTQPQEAWKFAQYKRSIFSNEVRFATNVLPLFQPFASKLVHWAHQQNVKVLLIH